jgi:hypothetical protein
MFLVFQSMTHNYIPGTGVPGGAAGVVGAKRIIFFQYLFSE